MAPAGARIRRSQISHSGGDAGVASSGASPLEVKSEGDEGTRKPRDRVTLPSLSLHHADTNSQCEFNNVNWPRCKELLGLQGV